MNDIIKKAVELADGWAHRANGKLIPFFNGPNRIDCEYDDIPQAVLDALAAQLVRQVDALDHYAFESNCDGAAAVSQTWDEPNPEHWTDLAFQDAIDDRTMNTIKAIVDSGVLKDHPA